MPALATDRHFMQTALDLARQGIGLTSPNPCVGAVIVNARGQIVGTGTHTYNGVKHAEVLALEQAKDKARGATIYINLEPCSYHGRTPPCADALIVAGIRRVVASIADPNPAVSGRGFEKLRSAGVEVEVGALAEQARRLNEAFARYIRRGVPFVTLKSAMTLDGKIAASEQTKPEAAAAIGTPRCGWITGEAARAHVHLLRHEHDALLVGIGTVLADDPLLTDRSELRRRRPLLRVVLDSHLRIHTESRLVQSVKQGDLLVFFSESSGERKARLEERGVRVERLEDNGKRRINLNWVLQRLGQLEITSLMIEGGATVNGDALSAGIVDKLFLYYAPKLFSGADSIPFARDLNLPAHPITIKSPSFHRFENDFAIEGYIRDPYEN
ncbi:MAG TPA: bifunctional diaminohydroxyphosphoribosylaminopyrimidine deaminase/5-amino-6-(5-phosphoribosylamino)uracil reductase RibD [Candidatus Sulfotelmatobacter sp.]